MADAEQAEVFKQGARQWNEWRSQHPQAEIDLRGVDLQERAADGSALYKDEHQFENAELWSADLSEARLRGVLLAGANFHGARLSLADLRDATLTGASLAHAHLWFADLGGVHCEGANLADAYLGYTNLFRAHLTQVNLQRAELGGAMLREADLDGADLREADLRDANLIKASMSGTDLRGAWMGRTSLVDLDLCEAIGLEEVIHMYGSSLDLDTLRRAAGRLPIGFLRGCGLSDWEIAFQELYADGLPARGANAVLSKLQSLRIGRRKQVVPLYLQHEDADRGFADLLEQALRRSGIRFWRYQHMHRRSFGYFSWTPREIRDQAVILVLSANSIASERAEVEYELRTAKESGAPNHVGRYALIPIALDNSWKTASWSDPLREQLPRYPLRDFSSWQHDPGPKDKIEDLVQSLDLY